MTAVPSAVAAVGSSLGAAEDAAVARGDAIPTAAAAAVAQPSAAAAGSQHASVYLHRLVFLRDNDNSNSLHSVSWPVDWLLVALAVVPLLVLSVAITETFDYAMEHQKLYRVNWAWITFTISLLVSTALCLALVWFDHKMASPAGYQRLRQQQQLQQLRLHQTRQREPYTQDG